MQKTLFDNQDINYTEMYCDYKEYCDANDIVAEDDTSSAFFEWVSDTLSMEWNDFIYNITKHYNSPCVVTGTIGRWNGRYSFSPKRYNSLADAISHCNCEDTITIIAEDGVVKMFSYHHDSHHEFIIHKLNEMGCMEENTNLLFDEKFHDKFNFSW
jgi:hypothetical protein